ncbi:P pilus assembly protein, pilin FimA [Burkholderia sp. Ch1-1]|uniref:P pilus assembly protein, pilin FimA n=1 Tax=Paraburkholderia dioscoreae TaxID=2604047 RepID=A0A5Q4YU45_9BURK|nr:MULTISPECIES: fimbrial protein [Paraburkholderia]EIF30037.1 P pilus assembly protein, pilin FimA [Burkholderia sp. Ch1-1]MDR8396620.1 type 1 fimbrial protein [Paraburkholderia sp. USG1]VVD29913.1 P pilus assembly protein, pilin FimA [Paraburkholderia dioscoreae]
MNRFLSIVVSAVSLAARTARVRWARNSLAAIGLMAALSSPAFAQYAFGQSTITVPARVAAGTVVARDYLTPQQLCYSTSCTLTYAELYQYGGGQRVPGPNVLTTVTGLSTRLIVNGKQITDGAVTPNLVITSPIEIQLVANGQQIIGGPLKANGSTPSPAYFIIRFGSSMYQIFLAATVQTIDGTCSVPDQLVTLPTAGLKKFGSAGTVQGAQSFSIRLNNCPAGFNRVGYSLIPVGTEVTGYPGALPLSADSSATGVRVRIADANGTPVTFNTSIKLNAYNKTTGGSYTVPYQASYIKTAANVTAGTVNGAMLVLVDYQ